MPTASIVATVKVFTSTTRLVLLDSSESSEVLKLLVQI